MQPLFLESSVEFEKTSAQTQLPEDPNAWPNEILQELYKQAPYVADFSPHVVMEKVDGEQGYGLGHVEIGNQTEIQTAATPQAMSAAGIRSVRVPVVIKDGMLSPFDLIVCDDSKVLPLTEARLRAAIFRPQNFDVTSRTPGDVSMIGQLYPPYRQSYGFGAGGGLSTSVGMGKEGSALESFLTEKTAGEFQSVAEQFMSEDYLKGTAPQTRLGKKVASGPAKQGALSEFVEKNASALGNVLSAVPRGAATVGAQATKNTAAAKGHATAAAVRAKNLAAKLKKASILEAILPTINESDLWQFKLAMADPEVQKLAMENVRAFSQSAELLLSVPERPKFASHFPSLVRPDVVQLKRVEDGYRVKAASHLFWAPVVETIGRGDALARFGEKVVLAADLNGAVTMADGAEAELSPEAEAAHDSDMQDAGPITEPGLYKTMTPEGVEAVGYVIPNLLDIDGTAIPLSLFTNGTQATVQGDIVGSPVEGEGIELPTGDRPNGRGVFATTDGEVQATIPLTISASMEGMGGEPGYFRGESFTGEQVMISLQPNLQTVVGTDDGKMLIPEHWQWVPLGQADEISLESQEDGMGSADNLKMAYASVQVTGGGGTFSIRGPVVEKLAHDERELIGIDDAMFLLAGLGVEQSYGVRKLAQASTGRAPETVKIGRQLRLASDEIESAKTAARENFANVIPLRQYLFKEAAALGDPQAVDTVLSLGFLNPENLTTFIGYLPLLEDAQSKLCDILLASRFGSLIDTPEGAIERSVRSMEAVLCGLKALAFTNN